MFQTPEPDGDVEGDGTML